MLESIRRLLTDHGHLAVDVSQLGDDDSLYEAGLTSHASVALMLALEDTFGVEFPERLLRRRTFESVASIADAIAEIRAADPSTAEHA